MSTDIQQARDILAKWRKNATTGNWVAGDDEYPDLIWSPKHPGYHPALAAVEEGDTALIVGTAGNPDLLDAIDEMLKVAHEWKHGAPSKNVMFRKHAERIAAAIIAANERMTS